MKVLEHLKKIGSSHHGAVMVSGVAGKGALSNFCYQRRPGLLPAYLLLNCYAILLGRFTDLASQCKMCSKQNVDTLGGSRKKLATKIARALLRKRKHPEMDLRGCW